MSGPNLENMDMDAEDSVADEILSMSTQDVQARTRLLDNEVGIDYGSLSSTNLLFAILFRSVS